MNPNLSCMSALKFIKNVFLRKTTVIFCVAGVTFIITTAMAMIIQAMIPNTANHFTFRVPIILALMSICIFITVEYYIILFWAKFSLLIYDKYNESFSIKEAIPSMREFVIYGVVGTFVALAVVFLSILFIIPGVWFGLRMSLMKYVIIDRKYNSTDAFKYSYYITRGSALRLLWVYFIISLIALGFGITIIGAVLTAPIYNLAMAYLYRQLVPREEPVDKNFILDAEIV